MTAQKFHPVDNSALVYPSLCVVNAKHISEMYDRFESGFCDHTTCNAVALSLSETIGEKVRVFRKKGVAFFETSNEVRTLPKSVHHWLDQVDRGIPVDPFRFKVFFS